MIREYLNGNEFIKENDSFLKTDKYLANFFYLDAPLLTKIDKHNFALKISCENVKEDLLVLNLSKYNMMLFGSEKRVDELVDYLICNESEYSGVLASEEVGNAFVRSMRKRNINVIESIGMDFMEARCITEESCSDVEVASEKDLKEICGLLHRFYVDTGLDDSLDEEKIKEIITYFRLIRVNGEIASIAKRSVSHDGGGVRISYVYTLDKYRGLNYAIRVVNTLKNEIINDGFVATLNVDKKNPISNHLYSSLGFKKVFSQGVFKVVK